MIQPATVGKFYLQRTFGLCSFIIVFATREKCLSKTFELTYAMRLTRALEP